MKLLIQSAMIFFGTLMAAAFVALGEPAPSEVVVAGGKQAGQRAQSAAPDRGPWFFESASSKGSTRLR